ASRPSSSEGAWASQPGVHPGCSLAQLGHLRGVIFRRRRRGPDRERHALDDLEPIARKAHQATGIIREQADLAHPEIAKDLRPDAVVAEIAQTRPGIGTRLAARLRLAVVAAEYVHAVLLASQVQDDATVLR